MSQCKQYPAYKDSGVQWLGQVPEAWSIIRLRYLFSEKKKKVAPFLSCGAISFGNVVYKDSESIPDETRATYQEVVRDEFLINPINLNYDLKSLRTGLSDIDVCVSPAYIVLNANSNAEKHFLKYLLFCFDILHMKTLGAGVRQTITFEDIGGCYVCLPSLREQRNIARILDREIARIDALIEKKTRFSELLREKRWALITRTVTKGLDPNVKMKDSGVDWLGQVPGHWEITYIKRVIYSISQGWSPECESRPAEEEEWAVLKVGCVNGGVFRGTENKALPTTLVPKPELGLKKGDVLVSRANTRELVGSCAVIPQDFPRLMLCDKLYRLIANTNKVTPDFLAAQISVYGRRVVEIEANGASSSMVNISQSVIRDLLVALPSLQEQVEIVSVIWANTARIDTLIAKTQQSIELLKERRTSLITAAVTGQIDLREVAQ